MYDTIYVNGDSHSQKRSEYKVYSDFLSELYPNANVINNALWGSNNIRIFRKSTEDLLATSGKTLAVIGFSFVTREEFWYNGDYPVPHIYEKNTFDFPINRNLVDKLGFDTTLHHMYWQETVSDYDDPDIKNMIVNKHHNPTKNLTDFIFNLVNFTGFLKSQNIDYLLFRGSLEQDLELINWDFIKSTNAWKYIQQDQKILDLDFSIPRFAYENNLSTDDLGHLLEDGHKKFTEFLASYV